jgi:hypothetical protein
MSASANRVTYGHFIFCAPACKAPDLPHEFVHIRQSEENGDRMAISYLIRAMVQGSGSSNPYEIEAHNVGH